MQLHLKGTASNIYDTIIGKLTRDHTLSEENRILIYSEKKNFGKLYNFRALISEGEIDAEIPLIKNLPNLNEISEGDVVSLDRNGNLNILYRVNSNHNSLLVTDQCNSNCIMCSQPPKQRDDIEYLYGINTEVIELIPKEAKILGITGGEPTLLGDLFVKLIEKLKVELPETNIHILTNGKRFSDVSFVQNIANLNHEKVIFGIPLYSDNYLFHDYIVQSKGAYNETLMGLYNLASFNLRIEIRIVVHKQTIDRLFSLAKFISKNLPFAEHVAFMGLENMGYTSFNKDLLWIDPFDYSDQLQEAVEYLDASGMNVSIYNHQLCILPESVWKFSRQSISDWKNIYLNECDDCKKKNECGGFFSSNVSLHSDYIKAFI